MGRCSGWMKKMHGAPTAPGNSLRAKMRPWWYRPFSVSALALRSGGRNQEHWWYTVSSRVTWSIQDFQDKIFRVLRCSVSPRFPSGAVPNSRHQLSLRTQLSHKHDGSKAAAKFYSCELLKMTIYTSVKWGREGKAGQSRETRGGGRSPLYW